MPPVSLAAWQDFLANHPHAHLLQTAEWGELKSEFGWRAMRIVSEEGIGAQILFRKLWGALSLAYIPKGPVVGASPRGAAEGFWAEVDALCRRQRAILCKVEADAWEDEETPVMLNASFRVSPHNIQPARTLVVDIACREEEILARMKQKTRYNIRLAEKKGVRVHAWDDLASFHEMLQRTGRRDGFGVHALEYYRRAHELFHPSGMCELLVAEHAGRPLAALMVFARGRRAWYIYGASSDEQRNLMPTYLLQWQAMRWARARGAQEYDLWGVPDENEATLEAQFERRRDGLWGVYRFKRGFGGQLRRAQQALDRVYRPRLYNLYEMYWRATVMTHPAGTTYHNRRV